MATQEEATGIKVVFDAPIKIKAGTYRFSLIGNATVLINAGASIEKAATAEPLPKEEDWRVKVVELLDNATDTLDGNSIVFPFEPGMDYRVRFAGNAERLQEQTMTFGVRMINIADGKLAHKLGSPKETTANSAVLTIKVIFRCIG